MSACTWQDIVSVLVVSQLGLGPDLEFELIPTLGSRVTVTIAAVIVKVLRSKRLSVLVQMDQVFEADQGTCATTKQRTRVRGPRLEGETEKRTTRS